ncbi:MAG TPA: condensation domain-containing protein, partial [Thermoanaerobaculia bacterium]|nr:condensation domain-containing protein [Thermoanaerobaculia bacterium]
TGRPKGVEVAHRSLLNLIAWHRSAFALGGEDRTTQVAGVGFDAAVWELWPSLAAGASLHLAAEEVRLSPARLQEWLLASGITVSFLPTPLAESLLTLDWPAAAPLRLLLVGGDELHRPPRAGLPFAVINNYGPTEATVVSTSGRVAAGGTQEAAPAIGRPIGNVRAHVLDAGWAPVPPGIPGELYVGGDALARGYLGRPDLTAERFVPNPFADGERLYRTGDLARWRPGGELEFLGRIDAQVKIRGVRIELGEIAAALLAHPAVEQAAVLMRQAGSGEKRLTAYLALRTAVPEPELRGFLRDHLPEPMVPAGFVILAALPLTPNGKLDRQALARSEPEREPGVGSGAGEGAPRNEIEELLAGIWAEVLGRERVGVDDDFFALGGHSLLATQVMSRVRQASGVELPLRRLFERPTVAGLAVEVAAAMVRARVGDALAAPPLQRAPRTGPLPLSFAQERLWFLDQLEPGSAAYNIPAALRLSGRLERSAVAALAAGLGEIVRRHEALRTTFRPGAQGPVQVFVPALAARLPAVDLAGLPDGPARAESRRLARGEAARPFDLAHGPLLRASLLRLSPEEHVLLLTLHHVVADGWSIGILVRELGEAYSAFAVGRSPVLPELPVQYADYAVWQRQWLSGEVLARQLAWWREQLAGSPE